MTEDTNRYSAFVSYRHMPRDRQWAMRIMSELEAYRTPKALQSEAFPDRIGHLFRDEDEIPASTDLSDQIKDALGKSDYLIVICSPDTPASRWVRREIELFQEMGKSERIIPLLIAGEPEESFPPELRRRRVVVSRDDGGTNFVWEEVEPVAADVRPRKDEGRAKTERRALMRLAAALLGCRFDDLAQRDEERRKARLRQQLGATAALMTVAGLGGLWWWDANLRVHTQYCANYGERWAVPFCVGRLSTAQQTARATSFRFHIQGGRVLDMARINGAGALKGENSEYVGEPWTAGVALWRFAYRNDARSAEPRLASAVLESGTGTQLRQVGYEFSEDRRQGITRFDRNFGVAERQSAEGSSLGLKTLKENEISRHSSIGQHRLYFDANGFILRRAFEPVGGGASVADAMGSHGRTYEYGATGLPEMIRNLDANHEPLVEKTGIAAHRLAHDARGDATSVEWLDAEGMLRANEQSFAKVVLVRDTIGNVQKQNYLSETGEPINRRDLGFASGSYKYDKNGNAIEAAFFGIGGKPTLIKEGFARVIMSYDKRGNWLEAAYFGVDGSPTLYNDGVARWIARYDERGNQVEQAYFGVDGKPTLRKGFARVTVRYDERGNQVEQAYFGVDGKPTLKKGEGIARLTRRYDEHGNQVEEAYFGVDGKPTLSTREKFVRWTFRYDERGNEVEDAFFGVDSKPTLSKEGIARAIKSYDGHGNLVDTAFFGVDGKPILSKQNIARWTSRYDERGNNVEGATFGLDGKPKLNSEGTARVTRRYDERGNKVEVAFFGVDSKPTLNIEGIARFTKVYDERGNEIEAANFGVDGKPTLDKDGYARVTRRFDEHGNPLEEAYFGVDGKPTLHKAGVARLMHRFDERGNQVEQAYFGLDGKPILAKIGDQILARWTARFDELGNQLELLRYGVDGKLLSDADMKPKAIVEKDVNGRIVSLMRRDAEGRNIFVDNIGVKAKYSYADGNEPIAVTYFDEHDNIVPVEVEVAGIVADSTAARIGLAPGDRLLSYAGEKLRSIQQLVSLVGKPGTGARKLVYQRTQKTITVEVLPGRLGVNIQNVRAAPAPAALPKHR